MPEQNKEQQCYIYTRISTQMENYSLGTQREQLRRGMTIAAEFSDVGPATERPQFTKMLRRIQDGNPDGVCYLLVSKLSRFNRDAADVLNNLQILLEHNVNLLCVEDGIDSASAEGKLQLMTLAGLSKAGV